MNQRTLKLLSLTTGGGHLITNAAYVPGLIVDLASDTVTTSAWTFANVGRREMKVQAWFGPGVFGTTAFTTAVYNAWIQTATTGAFTGTLTTAAGPITATTFGGTGEIHFVTNDRYMRLLHNCAADASCTIAACVIVEQRAS